MRKFYIGIVSMPVPPSIQIVSPNPVMVLVGKAIGNANKN